MYDLAIIGAGWAGFNAALKAKELGFKTCLIDKSQLGGTCLNLGCIPTKTLIQSAKALSLAKKSGNFGLQPFAPILDFSKAQERKEKLISQLKQGMQSQLKGIDYLNEQAEIISPSEIRAGASSIVTKSILVATGSKPAELHPFLFNGKTVISSSEMLSLKEIPGSLLIIGGGVIGCEFASLFSNLGAKVSIFEILPQLLPGEDIEISKKIEIAFKKRGIAVNTSSKAEPALIEAYELILVCVGRVPQAQNIGLEKIGVALENGKIVVDEYLRTNVPNVFAAGDCTAKIMLAHFAAYQGKLAAQNCLKPDNLTPQDGRAVPNCIFTDPEIASIGLSEEKAKGNGIDIKVYKFDFLGSGMARILDETEGFLKIIADNKSQKLLGASIIGPKATELIGIFTLAITNGLTVSQVRDVIYAHPTLTESIGEALR